MQTSSLHQNLAGISYWQIKANHPAKGYTEIFILAVRKCA